MSEANKQEETASVTSVRVQGVVMPISMSAEEFWKKWSPCDWPAIEPTAEMKSSFMLDLERVIITRMRSLGVA